MTPAVSPLSGDRKWSTVEKCTRSDACPEWANWILCAMSACALVWHWHRPPSHEETLWIIYWAYVAKTNLCEAVGKPLKREGRETCR